MPEPKKRLTPISVHVTGKLKMVLMEVAAKAGQSISHFLADKLKKEYKVDDEDEEVRHIPLKKRNNFSHMRHKPKG